MRGALAAETLSSSHHVQPTMTNEDGAADCTLGAHDTGPSREPAVTVVTRGATDEPSATDPRLEPSCPTCLPIVRALAVNYDSANIPDEPVPLQSRAQDQYRQLWTKKINPNARAELREIWKKKKPGCGGSPSRFSSCWLLVWPRFPGNG